MDKRSWKAHLSFALVGILSSVALGGSSARGQAPFPAPAKPSGQEQPASSASEQSAPVLAEKAWGMLRDGLKDGYADKRGKAVRSLGLLAKMGFEEGIGFIPFAGMGYEAFKTVKKNDSSPVRAAAVKQLAKDPDAGTAKALLKATTDKNWKVRAAALEALARRGDPSIFPQIAAALDDSKDDVRFTAAACVAHLSELPQKGRPGRTREAVIFSRLTEAA